MERLKKKISYADGGHASQLLRLMQDISAEDATRRGAGTRVLAEKDCTWVLINHRVDILRMPAAGEEIELSTWPQRSRRGISPRAYEVRGSNGELIISALSIWAIMDVESRRIISGESRGLSIAGEEAGETFRPKRKIIVPEGGAEYEFVPEETWIDRNGHMNNVRYLDAVEPMLPQEYRTKELRAIAVDYEHEILPGRCAAVRAVSADGSWFFEGRMDDKVCFRICETFAD